MAVISLSRPFLLRQPLSLAQAVTTRSAQNHEAAVCYADAHQRHRQSHLVSGRCKLQYLNKELSSRSSFQPSSLQWLRQRTSRDVSRKVEQAGTRAIFTGIVEEMGRVRDLKEIDGGWELTVEASEVLQDVKLGDSIAVNGTCLTVTRFDPSYFAVGLAPETLRRTSLAEVGPGSPVNLERSLRPDSRMGGHFVQGHVDGTGTIAEYRPEGDSLWVTVKASPEILKYIVPKGYIAVDGTSLTVVDVFDQTSTFTFMLVAYTQSKIVVPSKKVGDRVNLEVDIVGKYVERMMEGYANKISPFQPSEVDVSKVGDWGSLQ